MSLRWRATTVVVAVAAGAAGLSAAGGAQGAAPAAAAPASASRVPATPASASRVPAAPASASRVPAALASAPRVPAALASAPPVPAPPASASRVPAALASAHVPASRHARTGRSVVDPYRQMSTRATVAHVVHPTGVRSGPGTGRTKQRLATATAWGGGPVRLLVLRSALDAHGRRWLRVRLPDRPNDRTGWILRDRATLGSTPWRVVISRSKRTLAVLRAGRLVRRVSVVVGAAATPTPLGAFAVGEAIRQPRGSELGPWAIHLTAHSDVLDDYGGGPGRIALHGRAGVLLRDPLGSARSHGCVRMDDAFLRWLVARATAGTPVDVRR